MKYLGLFIRFVLCAENDHIAVKPDPCGNLYFGDFIIQGRGECRHGPGKFHLAAFCTPIAGQTVNPVAFLVEIIIACLIDHIHQHQKTDRHSDG